MSARPDTFKMTFSKFEFFRAWVYQGLRSLVRLILDLRGACLLRSYERVAVYQIRECWRWMSIETRRKSVVTQLSNVCSTYNTSEMFGYRSSRRVSNLKWTYDRKMICRIRTKQDNESWRTQTSPLSPYLHLHILNVLWNNLILLPSSEIRVHKYHTFYSVTPNGISIW